MTIDHGCVLPPFHPFIAMDVPGLMRGVVAKHADRPFLTWEPFEGERRTWTYAEAHHDVRRMAQGLLLRGVKAGEAVILHLDNSPESVLAWLACAEIGAVAVSTNTRCVGEEFAFYAQKCQAVGIITQPWFAEMARGHAPQVGWIAVTSPGDDSLLAGSEAPQGHFGPAHPFAVQFTSGTTSRPKAVLWTHANGLWGAMVNARHMQLRPDDVSSITNPLFHTVALAWQVLGSIWVGASVVVQPKFSASRFWAVVERNRCTWGQLGLFMARALATQPPPTRHHFRFNAGGMSMSNPDHLFNIPSFGAHGMTELITHPVLNDPLSVLDEGSIGRPAPEYEVRLVRADGQLAGPGESGELQVKGIRGLSLFACYLGDPQATRDAFTADGFFRTGDNLRLREDGAMVFADRLKDMLKVGGENVSASEVEAVIRAVAGVADVAVVGGPDPMRGEVPVAFVIPAATAGADLAERIMADCTQRLADFKRPRAIRLVDELPRILDAKVAKAQLRQILKDEQA
ncbi:AMP-binding protein [Novosphingobium bradum]|uniref:AMP-binding protein n=1 Tax=Novosphingobium bradum TaxID=1737444 RepID=A0ABV7IQI5_9SPHN